MADDAAVAGGSDNVAPDWETPLLAKAVMHNEINKMSLRLWVNTWNELLTCRQTRHWFPKGPRKKFSDGLMKLTKPMLGQLIQILTGHTYLNRHQAIIDESERQRIIAANNYDNADNDGNAIIDAPDPRCSRCGEGDETPLHILTECGPLATLRKDIFGREDLVGPQEVPDFSDLPLYKVISFFKDANFKTLPMRPFFDEYLPTTLSKTNDNEELLAAKEAGTKEGNAYLSKYLYRIP